MSDMTPLGKSHAIHCPTQCSASHGLECFQGSSTLYTNFHCPVLSPTGPFLAGLQSVPVQRLSSKWGGQGQMLTSSRRASRPLTARPWR